MKPNLKLQETLKRVIKQTSYISPVSENNKEPHKNRDHQAEIIDLAQQIRNREQLFPGFIQDYKNKITPCYGSKKILEAIELSNQVSSLFKKVKNGDVSGLTSDNLKLNSIEKPVKSLIQLIYGAKLFHTIPKNLLTSENLKQKVVGIDNIYESLIIDKKENLIPDELWTKEIIESDDILEYVTDNNRFEFIPKLKKETINKFLISQRGQTTTNTDFKYLLKHADPKYIQKYFTQSYEYNLPLYINILLEDRFQDLPLELLNSSIFDIDYDNKSIIDYILDNTQKWNKLAQKNQLLTIMNTTQLIRVFHLNPTGVIKQFQTRPELQSELNTDSNIHNSHTARLAIKEHLQKINDLSQSLNAKLSNIDARGIEK